MVAITKNLEKFSQNPMNYILTKHALDRATERFPHMNIKQELNAAVPYGMQLGDSASLLSPNGLVFIMDKNVVVTVMEEVMYLGNISKHVSIDTSESGIWSKSKRKNWKKRKHVDFELLDKEKRWR